MVSKSKRLCRRLDVCMVRMWMVFWLNPSAVSCWIGMASLVKSRGSSVLNPFLVTGRFSGFFSNTLTDMVCTSFFICIAVGLVFR